MVRGVAVTVARITTEALLGQLAAFTRDTAQGGIVAFDADGTLWSGDVSDDVFMNSTEAGLLRATARPALAALADRYGVSYAPDAASAPIARALFTSYQAGGVPELDAYAMMAWCYAGYTLAELHDLARSVLDSAGLERRLNPNLLPVLEWTRRSGLSAWVVSASPLPILEVAVQSLGFSPERLIGTAPALEGTLIGTSLQGPVPYANTKVEALRKRAGSAPLVAAFGDSRFDLAMLRAATFGVAVNPRPDLLAALADRPGLFVLS